MSRTTAWVGIVAVLTLGCESDEERCNHARVAAHDAWAAYAAIADQSAADTASAEAEARAVATPVRDREVAAVTRDWFNNGRANQSRAAFAPGRDAAISAAWHAAVDGPIRAASSAAHLRLLVHAALDASTGPAVAARDAARAVPDDPAHVERSTAGSAADASWEACQAVAP